MHSVPRVFALVLICVATIASARVASALDVGEVGKGSTFTFTLPAQP